MGLIRITPPGADPVTLEEMKSHAHVDGAAEDARIQDFIRTAIARLDGRDGLLGRALITQAWRFTFVGFPPAITLPLPPCQTVLEVRYVDPAGILRTLASDAYQVFGLGGSEPAQILPDFGSDFPAARRSPESVLVEFRAGYGDAAADVPDPLRTAIKLHAAHLFEHREAVAAGSFTELPHGYEDLIRDYRMWSF